MKLLYSLFFLCITSFGFSQSNEVQWLSTEKAEQLLDEEPKKLMFFIYTDWCGYCKLMEKKVLQDEKIADYINEHYYPIKLNAEQKKTIEFDGYEYDYVDAKPRGANQFAIDLLQGNMAYPGLVFLEEDKDMINRLSGVQPKELLEKYLVYLKEDAYLTQDWLEYSGQNDDK